MHIRRRYIVIIILIAYLSQYLNAQQRSAVSYDDKFGDVPEEYLAPISLDLVNVSLDSALSVIMEKGNIKINYSRDRIPIDKIVSVKRENIPLIDILTEVLEEAGAGLVITKGEQIAIVPLRRPQGIIKGIVVEKKSQKPLSYVKVSVDGVNRDVRTEVDGSFGFINLSSGIYNLTASMFGYTEEHIENILVTEDAELDIRFELQKEPVSFNVTSNPGSIKPLLPRKEIDVDEDLMKSIDYIIFPDELKKYRELDDGEKEKYIKTFWIQKDPLFLTPENEALSEHYSRIEYINRVYGDVKKESPGWKKDKGRIYLLYGYPNEIRMGLNGEIWRYNTFQFVFKMDKLSYMTDYIKDTQNYNVDISGEMIENYPAVYKPSFYNKKAGLIYYTASFRGDDNESVLEIYHLFSEKEFTKKWAIKKGIFLFDEEWNEVKKFVGEEMLGMRKIRDSEEKIYYIGKSRIKMLPGEYNLAVEFLEENSSIYCSGRQKITIDSYPVGQLKMSDMVLASNREKKDKSQFEYDIAPNPTKNFFKEQLICVYFEIYNLMLNSENKSRFKVEYEVNVKSVEEQSSVKNIFTSILGLFGGKKEQQAITYSYVYDGSLPDEKIELAVDMNKAKSGWYDLEVTVTDMHADTEISKSTEFGVCDSYVYYIFLK